MTDRSSGLAPVLWTPSPLLRAPLVPDPDHRFRRVVRDGSGLSLASIAAAAGLGGSVDAEHVLEALGDETLALREIAARAAMDADAVLAVLDPLFGSAVVEIVGDAPVAAGPAYRHLAAFARRVAGAVGVPDVRRRITADTADAGLRLGAYVEEFHYIRAAASYMAPAIGAAGTERQARILSEYLSEEYWHDAWVKEGLAAAGIPPEALDATQPLPSTLALLNLLRWTATSDLPSLCVCLGATEGTPESLPDIDAEFGPLRTSGLLPEAVFAPFERHARVDAEHDHGSVFGEVFVDFGWIAERSARRTKDTIWQYWYAYRGFFEGILGHYGGRAALSLFRFG